MLLNRKRATQKIRDAGLDLLIATSQQNVAYISDYLCVSQRVTPSVQVFGLLPAGNDSQVSLIIPSLEVDSWAEEPGNVTDITVYGTVYRNRESQDTLANDDQRIVDLTIANETEESALSALQSTLKKHGMLESAIGLDESNLSIHTWRAINEALPRARIVPAAGLFQDIRMVKTDEEISRLRRSSKITERAIQYMFEHAQPGLTEKELSTLFQTKVCELGGTPEFWLVSVGRRTAHTHARQSDTALKYGDMIKIDAGSTYKMYWSDVGRTKMLGKQDERATRIYEALTAGLRAATNVARPGIRSSVLFEEAVGTIRELGLTNYSRHHCGHGIGISVYDPPVIQGTENHGIFNIGDSDLRLESQMIINLETPYYLIGEYGFIVEDTLIVRDDGAELLTHLDHSLII